MTEEEAADLVRSRWRRLDWHHSQRPVVLKISYAKVPAGYGFVEIEQTYGPTDSMVRFRVSPNGIHSGAWTTLGTMPSVR